MKILPGDRVYVHSCIGGELLGRATVIGEKICAHGEYYTLKDFDFELSEFKLTYW